MLTRHFLKVLLIFTTLIAFGLFGVFLVSLFSRDAQGNSVEDKGVVPKERILAE